MGKRFTITVLSPDTFRLEESVGLDVAEYNGLGSVRKVVTVISGLDHLEGEPVVILADGMVVLGESVVGGEVTIPFGASRVAVGIGYNSNLFTLPLENPVVEGDSSIGRQKSLGGVAISFSDSYGGKIGQSDKLLDDIVFNEEMVIAVAPDLFTGSKSAYPDGEDETVSSDIRIYIRQDLPMPMTVTAIVYDYKMQEPSEE